VIWPILLLAFVDWPQFRGPEALGISEGHKLPTEFNAKKNVVWQVPLPPGHSSPIVVGKRLFVTAVEGEKLLTIALSTDTGKELWRQESPRPRKESFQKTNPAASPAFKHSSACVCRIPDKHTTPPGLTTFKIVGNAFSRMSANKFAATTSQHCAFVGFHFNTSTSSNPTSGTPFLVPFSRDTSTAFGSKSHPHADAAPNFRAAIARIPLPHPRSPILHAFPAAANPAASSTSKRSTVAVVA
jgi:hypothetical protein